MELEINHQIIKLEVLKNRHENIIRAIESLPKDSFRRLNFKESQETQQNTESKGSLSIGDFAKILSKKGILIGQKKLFAFLRALDLQSL